MKQKIWCAYSGKASFPEDESEIIPLNGEVWYRGDKSIFGGYSYIGGGFKS